LPAPGPQPANATQATAGVITAFTTAYNGNTTGTARASAIQDNTGIAALLDQVARGPYAASVKISSARVTQVVFTSPTEAAVRFDILLGAQVDFANEIGHAVLANGTWKVTRTTVCADLVKANAPCS
jgi:hypothetical protein